MLLGQVRADTAVALQEGVHAGAGTELVLEALEILDDGSGGHQRAPLLGPVQNHAGPPRARHLMGTRVGDGGCLRPAGGDEPPLVQSGHDPGEFGRLERRIVVMGHGHHRALPAACGRVPTVSAPGRPESGSSAHAGNDRADVRRQVFQAGADGWSGRWAGMRIRTGLTPGTGSS